jgi:uncharacterized membrane protein
MTWLQRYRVRHFLHFSFWWVPVGWMLAAIVAVRIVRWIDQQTRWSLLDIAAGGAQAILGVLSSSMLTFLVFAVSSLLLVVQLASAQLTPRIIAFAFSTRRIKVCVGVFVFSYTFALAALGRVEGQSVPQLLVFVAVLSNLISIGLFFWFVQFVGTSLRPVSILQSVWEAGQRIIDAVYPGLPDGKNLARLPADLKSLPASSRIVARRGDSGAFLAFSARKLARVAEEADCVIELIPQVGDFVSRADPLFRIYPEQSTIDDAALHQMVAFGSERTLEQDSTFAFRIMIDIASRALSPAINDPTTAVLALDQIHRLLRHVGQKQLEPGRVFDARGKLRLVYPTPQWEDFVVLAVSEIRLFGAGSIQIPRRLRAMLEHLIQVLPDERAPALRQELVLLHSGVERDYADAEVRRRAETGDRQGIGGSFLRRPD